MTPQKTDFSKFLHQFKETNVTLKDFCDFEKIKSNVQKISIQLNTLNYLLGKEDLDAAVNELWKENSKAFNALDILIAVRRKDKKCYIDQLGNTKLVADLFSSPEGVMEFLRDTGLADLFQKEHIKNLEDYVFGVETGLDSNGRKNRFGHIMENAISNAFEKAGIKFQKEVKSTNFPSISNVLGKDLKRFDFVIPSQDITYLIEVNFYNPGGGSKPNEVARSYTDIAPKINAVPGFEFVWITDGFGWMSSKNKLQEAYINIPKVYNLSNLNEFIALIKQ